ncbi:MAG: porin [Chitinophagales bacterium]
MKQHSMTIRNMIVLLLSIVSVITPKWTFNKIFIFLLVLLPSVLMAQVQERQAGDTTYYKSLIPEEKQGLLKNVSMIANMRFALRNEFQDGEYTKSRFVNEQFRLEIKGKVHDKVYFRFRDRYTRAQTSESVDGISRSTDLAFIRVDVSNKFSISAGKLCADWGAIEFDLNPIDVYEYSDIIEYADNFLTGVGFSYVANSKNQFTFQILDSRTKTFDELYGPQPRLVEGKVPLAVVFNWRGSLFGGKLNTIWSYAIHNEAKDTVSGDPALMNYIALGNQLKLGKLQIDYDYKLSIEDLDRTSIVSATVPDNLYPYALRKAVYIGHWLNVNYRVQPKLNLALVLMMDLAKYKDDIDPLKTSDDIRTAWGFIPTIEYYPFKDLNLRFYANWVGRSYEYSDYSKTRFGAVDYSTGRFAIGFVTPLGIF